MDVSSWGTVFYFGGAFSGVNAEHRTVNFEVRIVLGLSVESGVAAGAVRG